MFNYTYSKPTKLESAISKAHRMNEAKCVNNLLNYLDLTEPGHTSIEQQAEILIQGAREFKKRKSGLDAFMAEYDLSSTEGITLMCLAEALLRIPDKLTADKLIQDKICKANWRSHLKQSESLFVNSATWGLILTGKIIEPVANQDGYFSNVFKNLLAKGSEGSIRSAIRQAMKILGKQFVLGQTIKDAQTRAKINKEKGYRYSFDMLGEAAKTEHDAQQYYIAYEIAIHEVGKNNSKLNTVDSDGISVKLSALLSRYEANQYQRVMNDLFTKIKSLAVLAKKYQIGLTIDAEEVNRLEISLDIIEKLALDDELKGWDGLGLALQAYQKRAFYVIDWLVNLAKCSSKRIMLRLVKGAYWDSEIKISQEFGETDYAVFTRKTYTDLSYLACAKKLFANKEHFYLQFATHNAQTLASVIHFAGDFRDFELQCLHGMGDALYEQITQSKDARLRLPCRIYAPVGNHKHLLSYLVRRLLENGANSSFVNRLTNANIPSKKLAESPIKKSKILGGTPHPNIPLPRYLFGSSRLNSIGIDLFNRQVTIELDKELAQINGPWHSYPLIHNNQKPKRKAVDVINPSDSSQIVGDVIQTNDKEIEKAIANAKEAFETWQYTTAKHRAQFLETTADMLEENMPYFIKLLVLEAGKSIVNSISEIREAVDFCRYYAEQAKELFSTSRTLTGPTGENNEFILHGRGVFVCISPWNFPLAIFLGGITAAIAAGNTVIAKPAEQTPLVAHAVIKLLHNAGVPTNVVQCLPGDGETVGAKLTQDQRISGVIFTGSTGTAKLIQRSLANRDGAIVPLIAETGGQNTMIVDSSALLEQVTTDVINSAFDSSGQRCSALRVLYVQEDIADDLINMIKGSMQALQIGNPMLLATDIGPVIDEEAKSSLADHVKKMKTKAKLLYECKLSETCKQHNFIAPTMFEIKDISILDKEVFGPILHVVRFKASKLRTIAEQINNTGYGLTAGIHSRIDETIKYLKSRLKVGNIYVNRNQIGAVVGVQPFGGEGLSGTGPKAGGPFYLPRLAAERTISTDTTAAGGNATLISLTD